MGKKKERLMANNETGKAASCAGSFFCEGENGKANIGIGPGLVWPTVMLIVFIQPPGHTHPQEQVPRDEAHHIIVSGAAKDLPVPGIVPNKTKLGAEDAQEEGAHQHHPQRMEQQQHTPSKGQHGKQDKHFAGVIADLFVQQTMLANLFF